MHIPYHFELFKGAFWLQVQNFAVWKKTTTQDATFFNFLYALECAKDQNTIGNKEISRKWERGHFLVFSKGHLSHLPGKAVHMRPQLPLHEVDGVNNEKFKRFLLRSFSMSS